MIPDVAARRLHNQRITRPGPRHPAALVAWLGAVQAQEYGPARWGLALRMPDGATDAQIAKAFDAGRILRTHVMRPTWHFVTPADIRWMLELTAPRVHRAMGYYNRMLGLDAKALTRALGILERSLRDGRHLTRTELAAHLERGGLPVRGQHLAHVMMHAELEAVVCSGPRRGTRFTYALLAERAPRAKRFDRDEALATLTRRFFRSHAPATVRDFVWWSGLTTPDAKRGLDIIRARPRAIGGREYWSADGAPPGRATRPRAFLLPIYDEYLVAYRDRDAVPHGPSTVAAAAGGSVTFVHALVIDGQVAGTWRPVDRDGGTAVAITPLRKLRPGEREAIARAAARYGRFLAAPVSVTIG